MADECERVLDECRTLDIMPAREYFGLDCDRTRIALDVTPRGITGFAARDALTQMGINIEMADARRIVMICSAVDDKDKFDALIDGLKRLPRGNGNYALPKVERVMRGRRAMSVRQAALGAYERVELERAAGRIAARALGAYPPGVAECAPGEEISREICERLLAARRGCGTVRPGARPVRRYPRIMRQKEDTLAMYDYVLSIWTVRLPIPHAAYWPAWTMRLNAWALRPYPRRSADCTWGRRCWIHFRG